MTPSPLPETAENLAPAETWSDFLTPQQRTQAIAQILADIGLRILRDAPQGDEPESEATTSAANHSESKEQTEV